MLNLQDKLTVFIITCGQNPNLIDCVAAINNQTCDVKVDIIKDYTPMSKAFQEMLDKCETEFFIEVDEDMILYSHAIKTMYEVMKNDITQRYTMNCYQLKDIHLQQLIYGVKIYRTKIFKKYPYENCASCEVNQLNRMTNDGLKYSFETAIMGEHSPKWTPDLIYKRYYNLAMKYRIYGYHWMGEPLKNKLIELDNDIPNELNHNALLGYVNGLNAELITEEKSL